MQGAWSGCFQGCRGEAMQDLGYELPRISIPRTPVTKGMKKGREYSPARQINSGLRGLRQEVEMLVA